MFVVRREGSSSDVTTPAVAAKIAITMHENVGQLQRIEARQQESIAAGTQVIVLGASYLKDGERVSVVRVDEETP